MIKPPRPAESVLPTIYVTKYATTKGILRYQNAVISDDGTGVAASRRARYYKPYWYTDQAEAEAHAEVLRQKKVAALERQLKKLAAKKIQVRDAVVSL